jgi:glycosyltransferase involved in cell wall biosynthesis
VTNPLVSICVPTYNRASQLREGLKTICGQDYYPLEILISDNCSDDQTEAVCREVAKADQRVRYVRQPRNIGLYGNHNFCIDHSRGEFFCFFHDHDERSLQIISQYVSFLLRHQEVGAVCSDFELINEMGEIIGAREARVNSITPGLEYISQTIRSGRSSLATPGALVRRSALRDTRFDENGPIGFVDFAVWFQLAERAAVGHINSRLWRWRQERHSQSARTIESLTHDYDVNLTGYCDAHLKRWPGHEKLVTRWKREIRHYLFWALAFEVGLHFRKQGRQKLKRSHPPTLFEILDYSLSPQEFQHVLKLLREYRTGWAQYIAYWGIDMLRRFKITWPLVWATYHHSSLRTILRLR